MADLMREQFEQWECDAPQGPQTDPMWLIYDEVSKTYGLNKIQDRWEVWQASREAVVVELPERAPNDDPYCGEPWDCGYNLALDESREAIKAQGLKVAQ